MEGTRTVGGRATPGADFWRAVSNARSRSVIEEGGAQVWCCHHQIIARNGNFHRPRCRPLKGVLSSDMGKRCAAYNATAFEMLSQSNSLCNKSIETIIMLQIGLLCWTCVEIQILA